MFFVGDIARSCVLGRSTPIVFLWQKLDETTDSNESFGKTARCTKINEQ